MTILIAPNAFKGSLRADEAAVRIRDGLRRVFPRARYDLLPLADGGGGTLEALVKAGRGRIVRARVSGPLGGHVAALYGLLGGNTAVIEMAQAAGLGLVSSRSLDPMRATTFGVGELIHAALDRGARTILVGLGGSATVDGGAGMAQALGFRLVDRAGRDLPRGGGALSRLARILARGVDARVRGARVIGLWDVANPLLGRRGAARVFGPQKGAAPRQVRALERGLARLAVVLRRDLSREVRGLPGGGAAGGLGAGLVGFLGGRLEPGSEYILRCAGFERKARRADLVVTGEGRLDEQTREGKVPAAVAAAAVRAGVPVVCVAGGLGSARDGVFGGVLPSVSAVPAMPAMPAVPGPVSLDEAMARAGEFLADAAERAGRLVKVGMGMSG